MSSSVSYRNSVQNQRTTVLQLVSEKEKYHQEAQQAIQQYYTALEEVKLQENQITALMKKTVEADKKIQQQQVCLTNVLSLLSNNVLAEFV